MKVQGAERWSQARRRVDNGAELGAVLPGFSESEVRLNTRYDADARVVCVLLPEEGLFLFDKIAIARPRQLGNDIIMPSNKRYTEGIKVRQERIFAP